MSSHENNSDQEKDLEEDSVSNSMNLNEDENNDEENNYSSNNNVSPFPNNSNIPQKNISTKKHPKKSTKISKKSKNIH